MNIKIYGADWCQDCIITKEFLSSKNIRFKYISITNNNKAISLIEKINNGKRIIPTLDIDGKIYVNPGVNKLISIIDKKLNLQKLNKNT